MEFAQPGSLAPMDTCLQVIKSALQNDYVCTLHKFCVDPRLINDIEIE